MKEDLPTNLSKPRNYTALGFSSGRFFIPLIAVFFIACESDGLKQAETYEGPIRVLLNGNTMRTDSGLAVVRIKSPKRLDYKGGDQEWPDGLFVEIYGKDGKSLQSTFRSDKAIYDSEEDIYKGTGNVVVENFETKDELNTEELFWDRHEEQFYTEKFVTIISDGEIHTGNGLTADQNFDTYTIHDPKGTMTIEDEP